MQEQVKSTMSGQSPPLTLSWKQKAINCLAVKKHYMTTIEILACVLGQSEYEKLTQGNRRELVGNLSVTLNNLVTDKYIKKQKMMGFKGNYYGLSNWFEGDRMKPEFANATLKYLIEVNKQV